MAGLFRFLPFRTLRAKFLAVNVPLVLLSTLIVFAFFELHNLREAKLRLHNKLDRLVATQSAAMSESLWNVAEAQIQLMLDAIAIDPDVVGALVDDDAGQRVAQIGDVGALSAERYVAAKDIVQGRDGQMHVIGRLVVSLTDERLNNETRTRLLVVGILALLLLALVVVSQIIAHRQTIGIPLERLLRSINASKRGERQPVQWESRDEMGTVVSSFNQMQARQEEIETELRLAHDDLELRVAERTTELAEARRLLIAALESISEGFSLYDADDRLVVCNDRYRGLLYPGIETAVTPGASFESIIRDAAEQGLVQSALGRADAWVAERLEKHRSPSGAHVQQRADGRWIRVSERKTEDGGTVAVYSEITELKRREEELEKKNQFLHLNQIITRAANEARTADDALRIALERVCGFTHWPVGHVYTLADDASGEVTASQLWYMEGSDRFQTLRTITDGTRWGPSGGLIGGVLKTAKPVWIPDVTLDPAFARGKLAKEIGVRAAFAFPVLAGREVVAVLEFFLDRPEEPDAALLESMTQIGTQLGRVVERSRSEAQLRIAKEAAEVDRERAEQTLTELRGVQESLVQAEKMASLGQLTAGIAHEIKNPLNFVNNFAEVSDELLQELKHSLQQPLATLCEQERADAQNMFETLSGNLTRISEHGARADGIVKGMLAHAREGPSALRPTNLNALIDESLNLAFHGARAEAPAFNVTLERKFDPAVGELEVFPQEIMRVLLNLIGNAFYAIHQRQTTRCDSDYTPTLNVSTKSLGEQVEVRVRDNGTGIPDGVVDEIFNPFFTTKPTGEGTGLGLSLSYDIVVHQHHGRLDVTTDAGRFTEFIVTLPRAAPKVSFTGSASG